MFRLPRIARNILTTVPFTLALLPAACTCGSGPYEGDYYDGDRPPSLQGVNFVESEKGDPAVIGCADGQREGFADLAKHPRVAGCVGEWDGSKSLRDKPTGKACGDDNGQKCGAPADLCAPGWHMCGMDGNSADLKDRATANDCQNAGPGRFNSAVSHSPTDEINPCPKIVPNKPLPCVNAGLGSEPVCCGADCKFGKCKDGVWKDKTAISIGTSEGCGAVTSQSNGGVMCCYDGEGKPTPSADAKAPAGDAGAPAADGGADESGGAAAEGGAAGGSGGADAKGDDAKAPADAKGDDAKAPADAKGDDAKAPPADAKGGDAKADAKAG